MVELCCEVAIGVEPCDHSAGDDGPRVAQLGGGRPQALERRGRGEAHLRTRRWLLIWLLIRELGRRRGPLRNEITNLEYNYNSFEDFNDLCLYRNALG